MRWEGRRQSSNIEDRRSLTPRTMVGGGVGTLIVVVVVLLLGGDPGQILNGGGAPGPPGIERRAAGDQSEEQLKKFVAVVLADTEDVWTELMPRYRKPTLVLFRDRVESACGFAGAASGPFYCSEDQKLYIDLAFYEELEKRFGAPGDFAQAYVIAHEVGHHVQNQLGVLDQVHRQRSRIGRERFNELSVRLELQADFYAGVWAHHNQKMKDVLDAEDIQEGLQAASAIGDDRLQQRSGGSVVPESFTHGSSAQRVRWFKRGFETGDIRQGDTFSARSL